VANGRGARLPLLFFCGILQSGLAGNPSEEASDELVGELTEAEMDLLLKNSKGSGVPGELFRPGLLLLLQLRVDVGESLLRRWNSLTGFGVKTEEHRPGSLTLLPYLSFYARNGFAELFGSAPFEVVILPRVE
jgi:hypothetical protein